MILKHFFPLAVSACLLITSPLHAQNDTTHDAEPSRLIETEKRDDISVADLAGQMSECDVLFLGEQHDSDQCHQMQLDIIKAIHSSGRDLAISMEMFERDVQGVVDDYLSGRVDEKAFKENARPWKNYDKHYRPIVEFAKANNIRVIAANVPRRLAGNVATGKAIAMTDMSMIARATTAPRDAYYQRFVGIMKGHAGANGEDAMQKMYRSQCLKDDTMAESIVDYLATNPHRRPLVVHLCGNFHSDYGYGTALRVLTRRPLLKISVFTMDKVDDVNEIPDNINRHLADFVLLVEKTKKSDD